MAMKFKRGDAVVQITNPIRGKVTGMIIRDDEAVYLVGWTDENGDAHERPFSEAEIEPGKAAEPEAQTLTADDVGSASALLAN